MFKRLACLLAAFVLVACQSPAPSSQPALGLNIESRRSLAVKVTLVDAPANGKYAVQYALRDVATLAVGIFYRTTDADGPPATLGYFNDDGAGISTTNPLSATEFTNLQGRLGSSVAIDASVDKTAARRYLFKTLDNPSSTSPGAVTLTNFPNLSSAAGSKYEYHLFACAFDGAGTVIGYSEADLTSAIITALSASLTVRLNYPALGQINVSSTLNGSNMDPFDSGHTLLIGEFDTGSNPKLGWFNNGTTNAAITGSETWFSALSTYLAGQSLADTSNTSRYLVREYAATVSTGARTTAMTNLYLGTRFRSFIMAIRGGTVDAGHALAASDANVAADASTSVSLGNRADGQFETGWTQTLTTTDAQTTVALISPEGVAVGSNGTVYIADTAAHQIRKVTTGGVVTVYGSTQGFVNTASGTPKFNSPRGLALDSTGNVFVADTGNHAIRKIATDGTVTTFAGSGIAGPAEGTGTAAEFSSPSALAIDGSNILYVADTGNNKVRKVDTTAATSTLAGSGTAGSANGDGTAAEFNGPRGIAITSDSATLYVADTGIHKIRKITGLTTTKTVATLAGSGSQGSSDNATGASATFSSPRGVTVDSAGVIYVGDTGSHKIRKITDSGLAPVVTVAGTGTAGSADGLASIATVSGPSGLGVDTSKNVYVADTGNNKIRKIQ